MRVIELRNYLLKTGATSDFIRYFETHFLFSQREEGMHVLGQFEVVDQPCIWVGVWERAKAADRVDALKVYVPPPDRALSGTSSWINYFLGRDSRPASNSS